MDNNSRRSFLKITGKALVIIPAGLAIGNGAIA